MDYYFNRRSEGILGKAFIKDMHRVTNNKVYTAKYYFDS